MNNTQRCLFQGLENKMLHSIEAPTVTIAMTAEELQSFAEQIVTKTMEAVKQVNEPQPNWLSPSQVSERLGKDLTTLWRWEKSGYLIPERFGRKCRYRETDIIRIEAAERGGEL